MRVANKADVKAAIKDGQDAAKYYYNKGLEANDISGEDSWYQNRDDDGTDETCEAYVKAFDAKMMDLTYGKRLR